jgi:S1-C subfamily serine protease
MRLKLSYAPRIALVGLALLVGAGAAFAQAGAPREPGPDPRPPLVADPGVLVLGVQAGSPAEKAGIVRGDVILETKGAAVNTLGDVARAVESLKPGDTLAVKVRHGDAQKSLSVVLGTQAGRPWMGVLLFPGDDRDGPRDFPPRFGEAFPAGGAFVESVTAGSPAEKAGLKKGDLILSVDGTALEPPRGLSEAIGSHKAGDTVTLSVQSSPRAADKGAGPRDVKVQLAKNPKVDGPYLGVEYSMAPLFGERMMPGPKSGDGVFVAEVADGSPAQKAGITAHDLITKVDGAAVSEPQQVIDAVAKHKPGDTLSVSVQRWGEAKDTALSVTLGSNPKEAGKAFLGVSMRRLPGPEDRDFGPPRGMKPGPFAPSPPPAL